MIVQVLLGGTQMKFRQCGTTSSTMYWGQKLPYKHRISKRKREKESRR
ncbi:unnamed protein product [Coffea canephora]|uniref:Uncharacterized protein n=1 Tax=Coffea canephora TaxID=49390 RepID=A0A068ULG9_COFCA|nr:unnamed protein product [Coffea canephora]